MIQKPSESAAAVPASLNGLARTTYAERRAEVLRRMGPGVMVLRSNPEQARSNDTSFPFRQDSDFEYLTGFLEPDSVAVLTSVHAEHRFVLFVRPRDLEKETWNGRRAGVDGAKELYGPDATFPIEELDAKLPGYLEGAGTVWFTPGFDAAFNARMEGWLAGLRRMRARTGKGPVTRSEHGALVHEMRLFKSAEEADHMRRACALSADGHNAALAATRPGMMEYEVEALVNAAFRTRGARAVGYNSIVAGGENATILHYTENNMALRDGTLLLIDAGGEYEGYTADITRTFPVGPAFTPDQRRVYDIVLAAQLAAIAAVKPGTRFDEVHRVALEVLVDGLIGLRVLEGERDELIAQKAFQPFYMHRTSHWLGLDVHDAGLYVDDAGRSRPLEPGMVLTVEPGLYFGDGVLEYDPRWRGIGIRIEDDVLVTATGHEVLSADAIKEPGAIEQARAGAFAKGAKAPLDPLSAR
jgi:Xaa-Pro aminopeptidase